jgi:predicted DNA binding CopG/RHH family protein
LNSPPDSGERSSEIQTETMKDNRIDLWLDSADLIALSQFANRYKTSYQRIIETALTQAVARGLVNAEVSDYKRAQRIPIRLDQLGREQIKILSAMIGASHQDVLRLALQSLFANVTDHPLHD